MAGKGSPDCGVGQSAIEAGLHIRYVECTLLGIDRIEAGLSDNPKGWAGHMGVKWVHCSKGLGFNALRLQSWGVAEMNRA